MADFVVPFDYSEMIDLEGVITVLMVEPLTDEERVESLTEWVVRVGGKLEDWMVSWMMGPAGPEEVVAVVEVEVG